MDISGLLSFGSTGFCIGAGEYFVLPLGRFFQDVPIDPFFFRRGSITDEIREGRGGNGLEFAIEEGHGLGRSECMKRGFKVCGTVFLGDVVVNLVNPGAVKLL